MELPAGAAPLSQIFPVSVTAASGVSPASPAVLWGQDSPAVSQRDETPRAGQVRAVGDPSVPCRRMAPSCPQPAPEPPPGAAHQFWETLHEGASLHEGFVKPRSLEAGRVSRDDPKRPTPSQHSLRRPPGAITEVRDGIRPLLSPKHHSSWAESCWDALGSVAGPQATNYFFFFKFFPLFFSP